MISQTNTNLLFFVGFFFQSWLREEQRRQLQLKSDRKKQKQLKKQLKLERKKQKLLKLENKDNPDGKETKRLSTMIVKPEAKLLEEKAKRKLTS